MWREYHSQYASRQIGADLMRHNHEREPRGALWQGILASRRTRLALADSTLFCLLHQRLLAQKAPDA
ncbi:MAG TPA: hypothetical protein EYQ18_21435 [Candidatus Handelsmanbacteria bacterium]|nr:hypothetical protein [Candidatus Handelsmanbacteria bacterium]